MKKQVILLTGTSTGIGHATALFLANAGFTVYAGVRKQADGDKLKFESAGKIIPVILDVTNEQQIQDCYNQINTECGEDGLFALINNAGINYVSPIEYANEVKAREVMEVNFFGLYKVTQMLIPLLKLYASNNQTTPKIINISSAAGIMGVPYIAFYSASKFAVMGLSESLWFELKNFNIKVVALNVGTVKTNVALKTEASAEEAIQALPVNIKSHYENGLIKMKDSGKGAEKFSIQPEIVAAKITEILNKQNPDFRTSIGSDAKFMSLLVRLLPTNWRLSMMSKAFNG